LFKSNSWRLAFVKVCAYRKLVYPFKAYRKEADRMLQYIRAKHDSDMRNEKSMDDKISYSAALANQMSDQDNMFLLSGVEHDMSAEMTTRIGKRSVWDELSGDLTLGDSLDSLGYLSLA